MLTAQGKEVNAQALTKSVHFTLGSTLAPPKLPDTSQSVVVKANMPEVMQVTAIDCAQHGRPLRGFCLDPQYPKRRKLCVKYESPLPLSRSCLWENNCLVKMQQPEFVKTLQDKLQMAGPQFFEHLHKILKKDHLQSEIDECFLRMKQEMDSYMNELYSQFMYWSKHGMGSQLMMKDHVISEILFDERVV